MLDVAALLLVAREHQVEALDAALLVPAPDLASMEEIARRVAFAEDKPS
jgi:hypothetical protein